MRLLLLSLLAVALQAQDPKAQAVLVRHLKARGGVEKLKALKSVRMIGWRLLLPAERGIPWKKEMARPNKFREEITVQGMVEVHTFNGTEGWVRTPWAPNKNAEPITAEQVKALQDEPFDDVWIQALDHPEALHFRGAARFNGVNVVEVQWELGPGDELVGQFDQETGLEVMRERIHREMGNEFKIRTETKEWRTVGGLAFPFDLIHRAVGRGARIRIEVDAVDLNPVLPESRFAKP